MGFKLTKEKSNNVYNTLTCQISHSLNFIMTATSFVGILENSFDAPVYCTNKMYRHRY